MNEINRRSFLRVSTLSIGVGALLKISPLAASPFSDSLRHAFRHRNGEAPSPFSIVQLSDTHVGFNGPPDPVGTKAFERAVELVNGLDPQPELILFTGDLTHDSEDPAEHEKRFLRFQEIASRLRVKSRHHVPGEHDAALDGGVLFRRHFGDPSYSFDHRGVHFVALDNVSRGKPVVGDEQLAWLKKDLARYEPTVPIIVFTHRPLFDLKPEWEWFTGDGAAVMNVLAPYESVTVLYGHIHRQDEHTTGHAHHYAARSLIFAFPDPALVHDKKPLPFDASQPFHNLGIRQVTSNRQELAVRDVELTMREIAGKEGVQQLIKGETSL
jgi:hypothetical protein